MGIVLELYEILFASQRMIVSTSFRFFIAHDPVGVGSASCGRTPRAGSDAHVALCLLSSTLMGDGTLDLVDLTRQAVAPAINRPLGGFA
jgi:hypothetical protein